MEEKFGISQHRTKQVLTAIPKSVVLPCLNISHTALIEIRADSLMEAPIHIRPKMAFVLPLSQKKINCLHQCKAILRQ